MNTIASAQRHKAGFKPFSGYPNELEPEQADRLTTAGHIVPVSVGSENTYYKNAAGVEYYCKNYPNAGRWPLEYIAGWQCSDRKYA
jgi:hypothetical protein